VVPEESFEVPLFRVRRRRRGSNGELEEPQVIADFPLLDGHLLAIDSRVPFNCLDWSEDLQPWQGPWIAGTFGKEFLLHLRKGGAAAPVGHGG
jgi:hypothetical protein